MSCILEIKTPEDVAKLAGCHIHSAVAYQSESGGYLELQVSHIMMDNIVAVRVYPLVNIKVDQAGMVAVTGLLVTTDDVEAKE